MKTLLFLNRLVLVALVVLLAGCGGNPQAKSAQADKLYAALDAATREALDYFNKQLPPGSTIAISNIQSDSPALSKYIIDKLVDTAVNDKIFSIVDRHRLDVIRSEQDFQMSGAVDDKTAQKIGDIAGAEIIITGEISQEGSSYKLLIQALNVQTAVIEGNFAKTITLPNGPALADLTETSRRSGPDKVGLYKGKTFQGQMELMDAIDWIALNAKDKGVYTIVLGNNQWGSNVSLDYAGKKVTVILKAAGDGEYTVSFDTKNPSRPMFTVGRNVTFTLEDGVILKGLENNSHPVVSVNGGSFTMNGGGIKDNKGSNNGGGVYVDNGTFTMNAGVISGNTAAFGDGGGVCVGSGTFIMNAGVISGNTAAFGDGGGVCVGSGTFTMTGGSITGNTATYSGGGVCVNGRFTMSDGVISGNIASYLDYIEGGSSGGGDGGVCVNGTFDMGGGTVNGNNTVHNGGGVDVEGTFTMTSGSITGNTATYSGGGVMSKGTFTMTGGDITGNTASRSDGGGVCVSGTFAMTDGVISGNTTSRSGGGIYVYGTFTKSGTGGFIYGSNAPESQANKADKGAAVYCYVRNDGDDIVERKHENTVRPSNALSSSEKGAVGNWE